MDTLESYRRAQDAFDAVLTKVPADRWDAPSPCTEWTVRDIAGHIVWGQNQMGAWASGTEYAASTGFPGSTDPHLVLAGADPVASWQAARAASDQALTPEALGRTVKVDGFGEVPLAVMVEIFTNDLLIHGWDLASGAGVHARIDADRVAALSAWAHRGLVRRPGFFGPELRAPDGADEQARLIAFLGRDPVRPVRASA
ncbi:MAG: TIGR03086 family protein [Streptosporangiales bacterium]|nr:TIGR03086 family protein [Streptosporangiales bacterium]